MRDHTRAGRALRALLVVVMVLPIIGYFAPVASAHHPILSVDGVCNPEAGQWEITWTVANGNWSGRVMTVDQVDYPDNQLTDIKPGLVLGPNATESDTVWYPLSDLSVKTLTVRADWSDGGSQNVSRSLSIDLSKLDATECPAGAITVIKNTENPETSGEFTFLLDSEGEFGSTQAVAGDGGSYTWWELSGGTYDLTELVGQNPSGYSLIGSSCRLLSDDLKESRATASIGSAWTPIADGVSIDLQPGDHVECTFTNRRSTPPTTPPTTQPPVLGSIGDFVWNDGVITKANGVQDAGETGVAGVTVNLYDGVGTLLESTSTDDTGHYLFTDLPAGTYVVEFVKPEGFGFTIGNTPGPDPTDSDADTTVGRTGPITLAPGQNDLSWDAGLVTAEVKPTVVTNTTGTSVPETLPFTGSSSGGIGGAALALVLLGGLVLLGMRDKDESKMAGRRSDQ